MLKKIIVISLTLLGALSHSSEWIKVDLETVDSIYIDSLSFKRNNVFDEVEVYSSFEKWTYDLGNKLHYTTRESVLKKNVFFKENQWVPSWKLQESERYLRSLVYIADAEVHVYENATTHQKWVEIVSYDKWTSSIITSLSKESEWLYALGVTEYNLAGYGHKIGFIYSHQLERDEYFSMLGLKHFLIPHFTLDLSFTALSDGYRFVSQYEKPFLHRYDDWAVGGVYSESRLSKYRYYSRGQREFFRTQTGLAVNSVEGISTEKGVPLTEYKSTFVDSSYLYFKKSIGKLIRKEFRLAYSYYDQNNQRSGDLAIPVKTNQGSVYLDPKSYVPLWERKNSALGLQFTLKSLNYRKVKNFRNVKWTEDLLLSYWMQSGLYRNQESWGAGNDEWLVQHGLGMSDYWFDKWYVRSGITTQYYLPDEGKLIDGSTQANFESQFRETPSLTIVLQSEFENFYNTVPGRFKTLGGFQGLTGFPDFYYTGQAIYWFQLEQRWFPPFEWATALPVFALYVNGGNAWEQVEMVNFKDLNYRVGLGLRLGLSKSTLGIVNHINVSWPLNGPFVKSAIPTLSIVAKTSL